MGFHEKTHNITIVLPIVNDVNIGYPEILSAQFAKMPEYVLCLASGSELQLQLSRKHEPAHKTTHKQRKTRKTANSIGKSIGN